MTSWAFVRAHLLILGLDGFRHFLKGRTELVDFPRGRRVPSIVRDGTGGESVRPEGVGVILQCAQRARELHDEAKGQQ